MEKYYDFIILGLVIAILVIVIENKKSKENYDDADCDKYWNGKFPGCPFTDSLEQIAINIANPECNTMGLVCAGIGEA